MSITLPPRNNAMWFLNLILDGQVLTSFISVSIFNQDRLEDYIFQLLSKNLLCYHTLFAATAIWRMTVTSKPTISRTCNGQFDGQF